jgi:hypothetical protein
MLFNLGTSPVFPQFKALSLSEHAREVISFICPQIKNFVDHALVFCEKKTTVIRFVFTTVFMQFVAFGVNFFRNVVVACLENIYCILIKLSSW